jgi:chromosome partitioning protein
MTITVSIANQKGGVGKTTTAINLAAALSLQGQKTLLIDLDPQGNATGGSGIDKHSVACSVNEVLQQQVPIAQAVQPTPWGYDLLPANGDLTVAEVALTQAGAYDMIVIDCPPSLNMLTVNALVASDNILIPVQCEYYALEGLTSLMRNIEAIKQNQHARIRSVQVLRTLVDQRNRLARDVSAQLVTHLGDRLLETIVPRNVRVAESPSYGAPIVHYDAQSTGAQAYIALATEFWAKQKQASEVVV